MLMEIFRSLIEYCPGRQDFYVRVHRSVDSPVAFVVFYAIFESSLKEAKDFFETRRKELYRYPDLDQIQLAFSDTSIIAEPTPPGLATRKQAFEVRLSFRTQRFEEIPMRQGGRMVLQEIYFRESIDWDRRGETDG